MSRSPIGQSGIQSGSLREYFSQYDQAQLYAIVLLHDGDGVSPPPTARSCLRPYQRSSMGSARVASKELLSTAYSQCPVTSPTAD